MLTKKQRNNGEKKLSSNDSVSIVTYNIGNCSGGVFNKLFSASLKKVKNNLDGIINILKKGNYDICLLQEADYLHITNFFLRPCKKIVNFFAKYSFFYGSNVNIFGFINNGNITLTKYKAQSKSWQIPIKGRGFINNLFIVHKCVVETRIAIDDTDNELIIYNIHLAPFIKNKDIRRKQIVFILEMAKKEFECGNYVVIGGDWNIDLLSKDNRSEPLKNQLESVFDKLPWTFEVIDGYTECNDFIKGTVPSYKTIDGFLFSPNIEGRIHTLEIFEFSDHSPVELIINLLK